MALAILVALLASSSQAVKVFDGTSTMAFEDFIADYTRNYTAEEYDMRSKLFQASLEAVVLHNDKPNRLWTATINLMSDRTPEEMKAFNGWRGGASAAGEPSAFLQQSASKALRSKVQLTSQSSMDDLPEEKLYSHLWTAQKDQIHRQTCGNCWAAATASLLEAHTEIHMKKKRHYSFEELTECTENLYGCGGKGGCGGATSELALQEVMVNGIGDEEGKADKCAGAAHILKKNEKGSHEWGDGVRLAEADAKGRQLGMVGWERLPTNKYEPVMRALVERGPVAVAVAPDWQNYGNGIYDGCPKDAMITHSVLAMGYGKDKSLDNTKYWLIQNSWGRNFGENGHIRLKRSDTEEENCGTDKKPKMGTTCDDGPTSVKVCGMCGILYDVTVPHFEASDKS